MLLYLKSRNGANAKADYKIKAKQFIVLKGSVVSSEVTNFKGTKPVLDRREKYVKNQVVVEDVIFTGSSTAANFVLGRSTNGLMVWKDQDGKKLKEILNK